IYTAYTLSSEKEFTASGLLASMAGGALIASAPYTLNVQFLLNPAALVKNAGLLKTIGIYTSSAMVRAFIGTGAINVASDILQGEPLTFDQNIAVFTMLTGASLLRNIANGISNAWVARTGATQAGLLNRTITSGVNLGVTFGNVDMAVNNVLYRQAFNGQNEQNIGLGDAFIFSGKSFIGWNFGDDIKGGKYNPFGGASMGLGIGLSLPLIGAAITKSVGNSKLNYLFNPKYVGYGENLAKVGEGGSLNIAKWVGQRAVTYVTWTGTAVVGTWAVTKAHDAIYTDKAEQWGWDGWKSATNVATLAIAARFLASPNKLSQFLAPSSEALKGISGWYKAGRNAILILGGGAVNALKDWGQGNLNTQDGKFDPGKAVVSGLKGALYGKLLSWGVSLRGVEYFKGAGERFSKFSSLEEGTLESKFARIGEGGRVLSVKGSGILGASITAYEGALTWPFVSLVMGKATPVWDTAIGAVEKSVDHYFDINTKQPVWGWNYDEKFGAFRQQGKDGKYETLTAAEHFSLNRGQLLNYFESAKSGKYMGLIIKGMSKPQGTPILKNAGEQLIEKGVPIHVAKYIGGAVEKAVVFKEAIGNLLQKGMASGRVITRLAAGLTAEAGTLTYIAGFVTGVERSLQSVNRAGIYVDVMAGVAKPTDLQTTSGFDNGLKQYNNVAFSTGERWGLGWLLLFIKPNFATYATQSRYFSFKGNEEIGKSLETAAKGNNVLAKEHADRAVSYQERVLESSPKNIQLNLDLARALDVQGNRAEANAVRQKAISLAEQAVKTNPDNSVNKNILSQVKQVVAVAVYKEGVEHAEAGRIDYANKSFSKALSLSRESGNKDFAKGIIAAMRNIRGEEAINKGNELIKQGDNPGAQKYFDNAVTQFDKLVRSNPSANNYINLGRAQWQATRLSDASKSFREATKLAEAIKGKAAPDAKEAVIPDTLAETARQLRRGVILEQLQNRGTEAFNKGEYAVAERNFNHQLKLNPQDASAGFNLGLAQRRMARELPVIEDTFGKAFSAARKSGDRELAKKIVDQLRDMRGVDAFQKAGEAEKINDIPVVKAQLELAEKQFAKLEKRNYFAGNKDRLEFVRLALEQIKGLEVTAAPKVEPIKMPEAPVNRHQIGEIFGPDGSHLINSGKSEGRSSTRETILVDWDRDVHLQSLYTKILKDAGVEEGQILSGEVKGELIERVFDSIKKNVPYNKKAFSKEELNGEDVLIGETIARNGGVCRHMGILQAAILERMMQTGLLKGNVFYVRGNGHGWAVYRNSVGEFAVLDAAQRQSLAGLQEIYYGGDGRAYGDHMSKINEQLAQRPVSKLPIDNVTVVFPKAPGAGEFARHNLGVGDAERARSDVARGFSEGTTELYGRVTGNDGREVPVWLHRDAEGLGDLSARGKIGTGSISGKGEQIHVAVKGLSDAEINNLIGIEVYKLGGARRFAQEQGFETLAEFQAHLRNNGDGTAAREHYTRLTQEANTLARDGKLPGVQLVREGPPGPEQADLVRLAGISTREVLPQRRGEKDLYLDFYKKLTVSPQSEDSLPRWIIESKSNPRRLNETETRQLINNIDERTLGHLIVAEQGDKVFYKQGILREIVRFEITDAVQKVARRRIMQNAGIPIDAVMRVYRRGEYSGLKDANSGQPQLLAELPLIAALTRENAARVVGIAAAPSAGKSTAALFGLLKLIEQGKFGARAQRLIVFEQGEAQANQVYDKITGDAKNSRDKFYREEIGSGKRVIRLNIEEFTRQGAQTLTGKDIIILTEKDLEYLVGLRELSGQEGFSSAQRQQLLEDLLKGSVLTNTDYLDNPSLQISDGFAKLTESDFHSIRVLVEKAQQFLTQKLGGELSLKQGDLEIVRERSVKGEIILVPHLNDSLIMEFLKECGKNYQGHERFDLEEIRRKNPDAERYIAALKAAVTARVEITGMEKLAVFDMERNKWVIIPLNTHGRADNLRVSDNYQAIADVVVHNARITAGLQEGEIIKLDPKSVEIQGSGHANVSFAKMLDAVEKYGAAGTVLFVGAMTREQTRTIETLFGMKVVSKESTPSLLEKSDRNLVVVSRKQAKDSEIFDKAKAFAEEKGKNTIVYGDTQKSPEHGNSVQTIQNFDREHSGYTRFYLDQTGTWRIAEKGETFEQASRIVLDSRGKYRIVKLGAEIEESPYLSERGAGTPGDYLRVSIEKSDANNKIAVFNTR
ncbi:MAG: hypothetical protein KKH57_01240, partial [Candidatus Omnitrophica bacterium]|nr:hypothetical protein [Candidatus Omnitrophota bacterium]